MSCISNILLLFQKYYPFAAGPGWYWKALLNQIIRSLENIFINAQTQMLLLYSLECMLGEKEVEAFQCKFLANGADREKINLAREILLEHIGEPLTIRELSRKVAINECYLKKGLRNFSEPPFLIFIRASAWNMPVICYMKKD